MLAPICTDQRYHKATEHSFMNGQVMPFFCKRLCSLHKQCGSVV